MSWRVVRRFLLLAAVVGAIVWWYSRGKPSLRQMVDDLAQPVFGTKAAVKESERNRVEGQAATAISEQSDTQPEVLREGMSFRQVREVLGEPDEIELLKKEKGKPDFVRWTYRAARRVVVFEDGRAVSITLR